MSDVRRSIKQQNVCESMDTSQHMVESKEGQSLYITKHIPDLKQFVSR